MDLTNRKQSIQQKYKKILLLITKLLNQKQI